MAYQVQLLRSVQKALTDLPGDVRTRIADVIDDLAVDPRAYGIIKLTGRDEHRARVGKYRIIFVIDDDARVVVVRQIEHRRSSYRHRR